MADIKIYGTLINDTGEAIAYTSQVVDEETGKNVKELIKESSAPASEYMTDEDAETMLDSIFKN